MRQTNTRKTNQRILIVAAHPDDEVLGCGGTIAKYTKGGNKVYCLFLGRGKASRFEDNESKKIKEEQTVLEKEAQKAAEILGISKIFFENFPDQQYDTVPFLKIVKAVERVKNKIKPDIIFTHHGGDLNLDHQITFRAVLTACRSVGGEGVKKIYSFEVSPSTKWESPKRKDYFRPNVFVDVSDTFEKKLEAIKAYKSELKQYPHPRSLKGIEVIARRWGIVSGKKLAEAFELIREIQ